MILLNIQSSPRRAKSASIAVTNAFLDAYQALHSDATIDTLNVCEESHLSRQSERGKYAANGSRDDDGY